ncbi:hypothetical protein, partial [Mesorhizobium sp.]|uniref:hypothetical protein n=1 Tax=Mesorhizobium sp. TaxID=1871066 RepID=UPI00257F628D
MNGDFQRMTRETSLSRKDHAQMRKCQRVQLDARRFSGRPGNAWPFAFRASKIGKEHRAFA